MQMNLQTISQQIHEQLQLDKEFPFALFRTSDRQQFLHYHDCLELNMIERGEGSYIINGKKYPISPGDIFVINNREPHMAVHKEMLDMTVLVFDIELLWRNKGISQFLTPFLSRKEKFSHRIVGNNNLYYEQMADVFSKLSGEYQEQEKGWQISVEAMLMYLLTLIYRSYDKNQELDEEPDNFQIMYTRISAVFDYIEANFKESIALSTLAELVSISPHYLCKCFKKITGRTIFEYIEQMRVRYSCFLLQTTQKPVMEIALESGFNTVSYYNRIFKKNVGMTPKEYRNQNRNHN